MLIDNPVQGLVVRRWKWGKLHVRKPGLGKYLKRKKKRQHQFIHIVNELMLWYTQQHLQTFDKEPVYGHHVVFILSVENVLSAHGITELLFIQLYLSGAYHMPTCSLV